MVSQTQSLPLLRACLVLTFCLLTAIGIAERSFGQEPALESQLLSEAPEQLVAAARADGDPTRGAAIFYARSLACSTCHSVGDRPAAIGPDLAKLDADKTTDLHLLESVLKPSAKIAPAFSTVSIATFDGRVLTGQIVAETDEQLQLRAADQPSEVLTLKQADIELRKEAKESLMPAGQVNQLAGRGQFLDLMSYLIALRDGGVERARELQPPIDPRSQQIPDSPLPWKPVVQRGEVAVREDLKYPHGVAIGFVGGTVLFDANQLQTVASWQAGFVRHTPQHYFGLFWHRDGSEPTLYSGEHPLSFKLPSKDWQHFQPAAESDPNTGTKFGGYQIGRSAVRLQYHVLVGDQRVLVSNVVRAESREGWQGFAREFTFANLPADSQVAFSMPTSAAVAFYSADGKPLAEDAKADAAVVTLKSETGLQVARVAGGTWNQDGQRLQLVSAPADGKQPVKLRIDLWNYQGLSAAPSAEELASLTKTPPPLAEDFDRPEAIAASEVEPLKVPAATRPAVNSQENIDEFPLVKGKYLRFVVLETTGNSEPGIDELEIYGKDPKVNLALTGKASASSVIPGWDIHQIAHLNDGKLGNKHSWIGHEAGGGWAQIEFPEPVEMQKVIWARDRTSAAGDRLAVKYRIEVSDDGENWKKVSDESGRAPFGTALASIRRDATPGYELEEIPPPFPTWRPSDVVFDDDGWMYVIAMTEGQVWRSKTPPVGKPEEVKWQRFAAGLYHPIGLAVVDGRIYVAQKPEITELVDKNDDGIVEEYRTVAIGWGLSTGWHEYCFGLAVDDEKNLWFALNTGYFWTHVGFVNPGRWRGSVMRISYKTEELKQMATGCRVPNGITKGADGGIYFTDNQGDWIQVCKLARVEEGKFFGHPETKEDALPEGTFPDGRSAVWFPYTQSRSVSGPVCDLTGGKFGPFAGQFFVGDVGYGANQGIMRVALEKVNGQEQGACFRFVEGQPLGCERMTFGPDNQLYMTSLTSGLTRMAYTGKQPLAIESVKIRPKGEGFVFHFTQPLAEATDLDIKRFQVLQFHYLYTGNYGSPRADEKTVEVTEAKLSDDRKSLTLTFPVETYPIGMVYEMNLGELKDETGQPLKHSQAWYTVHEIPE